MSDLHGLDEHITGNWGEDSIGDDDDDGDDGDDDDLNDLAAPHQQVNWNIHNIWDVRDHWVKVGNLGIALVKKYSGGWAIGPHEGMDIWTACRVLNDAGATKWLAYDPFEPYPSAQIWR